VVLQAQNERLLADAKAYAIQKEMEAYKTLDDERLRILMMAKLGPEQLIAQAFENLTKGKNKVGNLNISPDLLQSLIGTNANANATSRGLKILVSMVRFRPRPPAKSSKHLSRASVCGVVVCAHSQNQSAHAAGTTPHARVLAK
jgi:hypothetical protein